jgi:hypothetical protein
MGSRKLALLYQSPYFANVGCRRSLTQPRISACRLSRALLFVLAVVGHAGSLSSWQARAQSIGINFVGAAGEAGTLQPTDVAGVPDVAQAWWNNVPGAATPLLDSSGRPTTMSVTWGSCGVGTNGSLQTGADFNLMRGSLTACSAGIGFHLTGIPYAVYDVVVYMSGFDNWGGSGRLLYRSPANFGSPIIGEGFSPQFLYSNNFDGLYVEATANSAGNFYTFRGLNFDSLSVLTTSTSLAGVQVVRSSTPATVPTLLSATVPGNLGHAKFWLLGTELRYEIQLFYAWSADPTSLAVHGPAPAGSDGPLIANLPSARCVQIEFNYCSLVAGITFVTQAQAAVLASDSSYLLVTPRPGNPHNYRPVRAPIVNSSNPKPALRMVPLSTALRFQWPTASREFVLESAPSLSGPWQSPTNEVTIVGDTYSVVVDSPERPQFFRLHGAR